MAGRNIYGELLRAQLHNSASDLTPTATGLVYFNTSTGLKWYDGSAWRTAVELTSTQALTNKDYDGGTASNSSRMTLPKNTTTNVDALTRKAGTLVYDTTTSEVKFDNGTTLTPFASQSPATATAYGVVKGGNVPGSDTGSSIATGYIGETVSATLSTGTQSFPTGTATDVSGSSITLSPGTWQFFVCCAGEVTGGLGDGGGQLRVETSTNSLVSFMSIFQPNGIYTYGKIFNFSPPPISISASTTYKLRIFRPTTNGTATFYHDNITYGISQFFAVRIG